MGQGPVIDDGHALGGHLLAKLAREGAHAGQGQVGLEAVAAGLVDHGAPGAAAEDHGEGAGGRGLGLQGLQGQAHRLVHHAPDGLVREQLEAPGLAQGLVAGLELHAIAGGGIEAQHHLGAVILREPGAPGAVSQLRCGDPDPLGAVAIAHGHLLQGAGAQALGVLPGQGLGAAHQGHLAGQGHGARILGHRAGRGEGPHHEHRHRGSGALARGGQGCCRGQQLRLAWGDQVGEAGGLTVHQAEADAEGLRGQHVLHAAVIHTQGVGPAALHEHLAVVAAAPEQGGQDITELVGGEGCGHRGSPGPRAADLPVCQKGRFGLREAFRQDPAVVDDDEVRMEGPLGRCGLGT